MGVSLRPVAYERIHGRQRASVRGLEDDLEGGYLSKIAFSLLIRVGACFEIGSVTGCCRKLCWDTLMFSTQSSVSFSRRCAIIGSSC